MVDIDSVPSDLVDLVNQTVMATRLTEQTLRALICFALPFKARAVAYWSSVLQVRQAVWCVLVFPAFMLRCFGHRNHSPKTEVKAQSPLKMDRIGTGCFKYAACHRTAEGFVGFAQSFRLGIVKAGCLRRQRFCQCQGLRHGLALQRYAKSNMRFDDHSRQVPAKQASLPGSMRALDATSLELQRCKQAPQNIRGTALHWKLCARTRVGRKKGLG